MIVCQCHGVTHETIVEVILDGAETVEDVGARCSAGTSCGGCASRIESLLLLADESVA